MRFPMPRSAILLGLLLAAVAGCYSSTTPATNGGGGATIGPLPGEGEAGAGSSGKETIKIVSSLPRTGSAKAQTDTIVNGIKMALEDADWKAGDFAISYLDMDDATASAGQWTAEAERANADRAMKDPDVMVYIGTYNSGAAKISMPILNEAELLMISPANTWPGFTKSDVGDPGEPEMYRPTGRVTYTRVVPADDLQALRAAEWAKEMGIKTVYILDDNEVYGRGIARLFHDFCEELEIEVLGHDSIDGRQQEYRATMTTIKPLDPDLIYFGGTTQNNAGQIAKDLVASGMDAKLMVPDGCMEEAFIEAAGADNLNGRCFVTFGGKPPEKLEGAGKEFVDRYVERFDRMPEAYAVYGYEAARVALEAIRRAGKKDRLAIVEACLAIRDFDGALGTWSFDENGDTTLTAISANKVEDGKFEFVKLLGE
jgi:branched-chain amino acid transport system substrate-binding protein